MGTVKIEKIGGLAGYGLPGSRLKSSGETAISALSPADQAWVEASFQKVTPQLIQKTAQEYLRKGNRTILIIEPKAEPKAGAQSGS